MKKLAFAALALAGATFVGVAAAAPIPQSAPVIKRMQANENIQQAHWRHHGWNRGHHWGWGHHHHHHHGRMM
jgi:hypothetical protein